MGTKYNGDIKELIDSVIKENMKALKKNDLIKESKMTPYQKTEKVLYDYDVYKKAIEDKKEKIEEIRQVGIRKKSGSIIPMPTGSHESLTDEEKNEQAIETLRNSIALTERFIALIDNALKKVEDDLYYQCIDMIYFKKWTIEEVASKFGCDPKTLRKNRTRLVNQVSIYLFSDEVIMDILK